MQKTQSVDGKVIAFEFRFQTERNTFQFKNITATDTKSEKATFTKKIRICGEIPASAI